MKTKQISGVTVFVLLACLVTAVASSYVVLSLGGAPSVKQSEPSYTVQKLTEKKYLIILNKDSIKPFEQIEQALADSGLKVDLTVKPYVMVVRQSAKSRLGWENQIRPDVFKVTSTVLDSTEINAVFGQDLVWLPDYWNNSIKEVSVKMAAAVQSATVTTTESDVSDGPIKALRSPQKADESLEFDAQDLKIGPMRGKIGVKVFFIESAASVTPRNGGNTSGRGTETWQDRYKIDQIASRILLGYQFWLDKASLNNVNLSFDFQYFTPFNGNADIVTIPYEPINCNVQGSAEGVGWACNPSNVCCETEWVNSVIDNMDSHFGLSTNGPDEDIFTRLLNKHDFNFMKINPEAKYDRVYTIFVVNSSHDPDQLFRDGKPPHAFMSGGPIVLNFNQNNPDYYIGGSINVLTSSVAAHETGHIFNAFDEYKDSGCQCSESWNNCANDSCEVSRSDLAGTAISTLCRGTTIVPKLGCVMNWNFIGNWGPIIPTFENPCASTRCQIGWGVCPDQGQPAHSSPFSAQSLSINNSRQNISSYICPTFDEDWYSFQVASPGNIKLTLSSPVGFLDNLSLFDSSGKVLEKFEDEQYTKMMSHFVTPGTYYARVYGHSTGVIDPHRALEVTTWTNSASYQLDYLLESGASCSDCFAPETCSQ